MTPFSAHHAHWLVPQALIIYFLDNISIAHLVLQFRLFATGSYHCWSRSVPTGTCRAGPPHSQQEWPSDALWPSFTRWQGRNKGKLSLQHQRLFINISSIKTSPFGLLGIWDPSHPTQQLACCMFQDQFGLIYRERNNKHTVERNFIPTTVKPPVTLGQIFVGRLARLISFSLVWLM